jgi:hypothetical protein
MKIYQNRLLFSKNNYIIMQSRQSDTHETRLKTGESLDGYVSFALLRYKRKGVMRNGYSVNFIGSFVANNSVSFNNLLI